MYKKLIKLLKSQTAKDASAMTIATGVSAVVAAMFFILVARILGPEKLGIFSLATAASFMFADIFDIAMNSSLIRFVARERVSNKVKANRFLKYIFKLKIKISLSLIVLLTLFSSPLSRLLFGKSLPNILILTSIGTGFQLLMSFAIYHLQARNEFFKAGSSIVILPTIRLMAFIILLLIDQVNVLSILMAYFFSTPLATVIATKFAPTDFFQVKNEKIVAKEFLNYNIPLTIGFSMAAIGGRIDSFILANIASAKAVGYYSAAFRLFTPFQFLAGSLSTVFAPRFSSFSEIKQVKNYILKAIGLTGLLSFGLILMYPFSSFIIKTIFGLEFLPSSPPFRILIFGFAVFILQAPFISTIMYYFSKAKTFAIIAFFQLVLITTFNLILIKKYQESGAALAFLITQIIILIIAGLYVYKKISQTEKLENK